MNVIISGCSCSGKTTLSNRIVNECRNAIHFEEDWYFKNRESIPRSKGYYLLESPNAFYLDEFKNDVYNLLSNGKVLVPRYDVRNNIRVAKDKIMYAGNINIFDGLHTISVLGDLDNSIKVFMLTDLDECLDRKIRRDSSYGIDSELVRNYFKEVLVPLYKLYIEQQCDISDYVIRKDSDEECLLRKLVKY